MTNSLTMIFTFSLTESWVGLHMVSASLYKVLRGKVRGHEVGTRGKVRGHEVGSHMAMYSSQY